jgi:hypothetical protein
VTAALAPLRSRRQGHPRSARWVLRQGRRRHRRRRDRSRRRRPGGSRRRSRHAPGGAGTTHGPAGIRSFIGSVARGVARRAACPVLAVPATSTLARGGWALERPPQESRWPWICRRPATTAIDWVRSLAEIRLLPRRAGARLTGRCARTFAWGSPSRPTTSTPTSR